MQDPLLKISDLNAYYGKSHVLRDINLIVPPAELVAVIGPTNMVKLTMRLMEIHFEVSLKLIRP